MRNAFRLLLWLLLLWASTAAAYASFDDSKAWFERLSDDERSATQTDLILLGHYQYLVDGQFGRGTFDAGAIDALEVYQNWMAVNGRSIYGAGPSDLPVPAGCRYTQRGNRLYLHVYNWPYRHIHIEGLADRIAYAQFLHDASEVRWLSQTKEVDSNIGVMVPEGMITLELPVRRPDVTVPVIEIVLKA